MPLKSQGSPRGRVRRGAASAPAGALQVGGRVFLRHLRADDEAGFTAQVRASRALHRGLVFPPTDAASFAGLLLRVHQPRAYQIHVVCRREDGALCGVMNLTEIQRGPLESANLGYYALSPHAGQGYMREGMVLVLRQAFTRLKLHRVEVAIQPDNSASIALALAGGFRPEGYSPRFLKIGGRWRDHVRFALLSEDWRRSRRRASSASE